MSTSTRGDSGPRQKFPVTFRQPIRYEEPTPKRPVSKEMMAEHLGQERPCITVAQTYYADGLYKSVSNLVFKLAVKYHPTCPRSEVGDMAQDCWVRIVKKLHLYRMNRSCFTTWVYKVCSSVLNKSYKRSKKRASRYVEMPDGLDENRTQEEAALGDFRNTIDLKGIIRKLKVLYPERKSMIDAIFVSRDGLYNSDVVYRSAAVSCGSTAAKVSRFFKEKVRPFFIDQFKESTDE